MAGVEVAGMKGHSKAPDERTNDRPNALLHQSVSAAQREEQKFKQCCWHSMLGIYLAKKASPADRGDEKLTAPTKTFAFLPPLAFASFNLLNLIDCSSHAKRSCPSTPQLLNVLEAVLKDDPPGLPACLSVCALAD